MSRSSKRLAFFFVCLTLYAEAAPDPLGVWKASQAGLPFVTITIERWNGKLTGAILFYLIRREQNGTQTASAGVPEPLLNVSQAGNTVTFEVSHRNAHPPGSLTDPPVEFKLQLKDSKNAVITGPESPPLELTRIY